MKIWVKVSALDCFQKGLAGLAVLNLNIASIAFTASMALLNYTIYYVGFKKSHIFATNFLSR
jgi:hypothetical protein